MVKAKFIVVLIQEEDGFVAECPSLPGCFSQGNTREEALANIREAIELSLETRAAEELPPGPLSTEVTEVQVAING